MLAAARDARWIAVVGAAQADAATAAAAEQAGAAIAAGDAVLVCGGLGGVMEAACRGARSAGGLTVGILPGLDRGEANGWVQIALPTGLGDARNLLVVRAAAAVVAIGGAWGTLSEIAFACGAGTPVVGVGTWQLDTPDRAASPPGGVEHAPDARTAVARALELAG